MILFDTTVLIDHLRGSPPASRLLLEAVRRDEALCSVVSRFEIEGGMRSGERFAVARLMEALRIEAVTDQIAGRAGELMREYRRSHPGIDPVDYLIAATAQVHHARLVTLNIKHFPMFAGLRSPY